MVPYIDFSIAWEAGEVKEILGVGMGIAPREIVSPVRGQQVLTPDGAEQIKGFDFTAYSSEISCWQISRIPALERTSAAFSSSVTRMII